MARTLGMIRQRRQPAPRVIVGDSRALLTITGRIGHAYTQGMVINALLICGIVGLGAWLIGLQAWLLLGGIALLGEVVPVFGSWLALGISLPVVLITQPDRALLALGFFLGVQVLDSVILAPRLQGGAVHFSLPISLLLLVAGGIIAGPLGAILALPAAALLRDVTRYAKDRAGGLSPTAALGRQAALPRGRIAARSQPRA